MMTPMIPVSQPLIARNAKKYILDCLATGWVSSKGSYIEKFEKAFARFVGTKYAVASSSGTSALHLALAALNIGTGDEVIVPTLTMIATALPVVYCGAVPVLVDSEPTTGNIDVTRIAAKITKKTRAIIPVHLHGHPADMKEIMKLARKNKLAVIEDAAEAHGAKIQMANDKLQMTNGNTKDTDQRVTVTRDPADTRSPASLSQKTSLHKKHINLTGKTRTDRWDTGPAGPAGPRHWQKVGSFGDMGCFSFYGNKIITTGEGGMVTTNNKKLADRMRSLRNLARTPGKHFLHQEVAFAYRLSNLQAALGLAQTEEADRFVTKKKSIAKRYNQLLQEVSGIILPTELPGYSSVYWQYGILFETRRSRDTVEKRLVRAGIETREFFVPLNHQPALTKRGLFRGERYPVAESLSRQGLCLPSGLGLTEKELNYVSKILRRLLR